jgi:hypothetical protein
MGLSSGPACHPLFTHAACLARAPIHVGAWQVACSLFSLCNLYLNTTYLPFYKPIMNIANIVHGAIFAWATFLLATCVLRGMPEVGAVGAGWGGVGAWAHTLL